MSKRNKLFSMVVAFVFGVSVLHVPVSNAYANENNSFSAIVDSVNTRNAKVVLGISELGLAKIDARFDTVVAATSELTVELQIKNSSTGTWSSVKKWEKKSSSTANRFELTHMLLSRGTYRAKMNVKVIKNGKTETLSKISNNVVY